LFLSLLDRFVRFADTRSFKNELASQYPRGIPSLHTLFFLLEDAIDWIEEQVVTMPQPFLGYFHIPLLIHKPGQQSREDVFQRTTAADILPTLMQITDQPVPDWCEGAVLPTFGGAEAPVDRLVYAVEAKSNPKYAALTEATAAMYQDDMKLIRYFGYTDEDRIVK
jgi:hypothetical protein